MHYHLVANCISFVSMFMYTFLQNISWIDFKFRELQKKNWRLNSTENWADFYWSIAELFWRLCMHTDTQLTDRYTQYTLEVCVTSYSRDLSFERHKHTYVFVLGVIFRHDQIIIFSINISRCYCCCQRFFFLFFVWCNNIFSAKAHHGNLLNSKTTPLVMCPIVESANPETNPKIWNA